VTSAWNELHPNVSHNQVLSRRVVKVDALQEPHARIIAPAPDGLSVHRQARSHQDQMKTFRTGVTLDLNLRPAVAEVVDGAAQSKT